MSSPLRVGLVGATGQVGAVMKSILAKHESETLMSRPTMIEAAKKAVELAKARA